MGSKHSERPASAETTALVNSWISRVMVAARAGAPSLRALLTGTVELRIAFGSTWEAAHGATIVSEWLAGRFAVAQHMEVVGQTITGSRVTARINFGGDPSYPVAWVLEAAINGEGLATEITLRTQGSA
jgi:uncharacterized protein (DUF697 family)